MGDRATRILVVEDLEEHRELLSQVLGDLGYAVTTAGDGQAALEAIASLGAPAMVLLDLRMPGMDGAEFLVRLRAHEDPALARAPVVLMTADPTGATRRLERAPPDLTLSKPFGLRELRQVVVRFCGQGTGVRRWAPAADHDRP